MPTRQAIVLPCLPWARCTVPLMVAAKIRRPHFGHVTLILLSSACVLAASASPASASGSGKTHGRPNLVVKRISGSPLTAAPGGSFTLGDWTRNAGRTLAKPSKTAYLLSVGTTSSGAGTVLGKRRVPRLRPGQTSKGTLSVTLPPSISAGVYHLIACADYRPKLKGHKVKNHCRVAPGTVTVAMPGATPVKVPRALAPACTPSAGSPVDGIDVSDYQGSIDFSQVAASGVRFVFAAADDGTLSRLQYANYKKGAESAGLAFGAYQFFEPNQDPVAQAERFLADAALGSGNLLPVLDVEPSGELPAPSALKQDLSKWLQIVQDSLAVRPLIYTGKSLWDPNVEAGLAAAGYPLWVASWTAPPPNLPTEWSNWAFWQYSASGSVPGISTAVDLDRSNGGTPCTIP